MKLTFDYVSQSLPIDLTSTGKPYRATMGDKTVEVETLCLENGRLNLLIDTEHCTAYISSDKAKRWVTINGRTWQLTKSAGTTRRGGHAHHAAGELLAPMPGQVRAVNVSAGEAVTKGQTLAIVEAMKMEIKVVAPFDGVVESVAVKVGQTVERDQILIALER